MLFFSFGLPGAGAERCDDLIHRLLAQSGAAIPIVNADVPGALDQHMAVASEGDCLIVSRRPSTALAALIATAERPCLIVLRDPRECVAELMDSQNHTMDEALRAVSAGCAALAPMIGAPYAFILRYEETCDSATATRQIAQLFDISVSDDMAADLMRIQPNDLKSSESRLTEAQQRLVDDALAGYVTLFSGGELGEIRWGRELFRMGDAPMERPIKAIDMTGRSRCLIYGPYLCLPAGAWTATLLIAFAPDAIGETLVCEVCTTESIGYAVFEASGSGVYEIELNFDLASADAAIELRIFNQRASFEGRILFGGTVLTMRQDTLTSNHND